MSGTILPMGTASLLNARSILFRFAGRRPSKRAEHEHEHEHGTRGARRRGGTCLSGHPHENGGLHCSDFGVDDPFDDRALGPRQEGGRGFPTSGGVATPVVLAALVTVALKGLRVWARPPMQRSRGTSTLLTEGRLGVNDRLRRCKRCIERMGRRPARASTRIFPHRTL